MQTTNSYFSKHKQLSQLKQSRLKKIKPSIIIQPSSPTSPTSPYSPSPQNKNSPSPAPIESPSHQLGHQKSSQSLLDLSLDDLKTEEQKIYEEYKIIRNNYQSQLRELNVRLDVLKREAELEIRKVRQAENGLQAKKKQLDDAKARYEKIKESYKKEEGEKVSQDTLRQLERELEEVQRTNDEKIRKLEEEEQATKQQIAKLQQKHNSLKLQHTKALQFSDTAFQTQKQNLQQQQKSLRSQLQALQSSTSALKSQIAKIQQMKPTTNDHHKKYLSIFQKIFIARELAKAQAIMRVKEQEKKQAMELASKKAMLEDRQREIGERETRISQKNKLVEALTNEIREKSMLLLSKYQQQVDKHKR